MINKIIRKVFTDYLYFVIKSLLSPFKVTSWGNKYSLFNLFVIKLMSNSSNYFIENRGIKFQSIYRVCSIRGKRAWNKEPETIKWIKDYICDRDVFFDIGANIGVYSLIANHLKKDLKIFSFEPEAQSYSELNNNIRLNKAEVQIQAFNIALSDKNSIGILNLSSDQPGKSDHQYTNDSCSEVTHQQGCLSLTVDSMINDYKLPYPNHIKIDVDGLEFEILNGAKSILTSTQLKSIAVEVDEENLMDIELFLKEFNFTRLLDREFVNQEYNLSNSFFIRE
jgi:FkbM family methyltransferase